MERIFENVEVFKTELLKQDYRDNLDKSYNVAIVIKNLKYQGEREKVSKVRNTLKGGRCMELAKVTSKGQITIPIEIRKKLGIKEGSKVLFLEESGRIYLANSSIEALREAQAAFAGEAERVGLKTEEDVVAMVKELRKEKTVK